MHQQKPDLKSLKAAHRKAQEKYDRQMDNALSTKAELYLYEVAIEDAEAALAPPKPPK